MTLLRKKRNNNIRKNTKFIKNILENMTIVIIKTKKNTIITKINIIDKIKNKNHKKRKKMRKWYM